MFGKNSAVISPAAQQQLGADITRLSQQLGTSFAEQRSCCDGTAVLKGRKAYIDLMGMITVAQELHSDESSSDSDLDSPYDPTEDLSAADLRKLRKRAEWRDRSLRRAKKKQLLEQQQQQLLFQQQQEQQLRRLSISKSSSQPAGSVQALSPVPSLHTAPVLTAPVALSGSVPARHSVMASAPQARDLGNVPSPLVSATAVTTTSAPFTVPSLGAGKSILHTPGTTSTTAVAGAVSSLASSTSPAAGGVTMAAVYSSAEGTSTSIFTSPTTGHTRKAGKRTKPLRERPVKPWERNRLW